MKLSNTVMAFTCSILFAVIIAVIIQFSLPNTSANTGGHTITTEEINTIQVGLDGHQHQTENRVDESVCTAETECAATEATVDTTAEAVAEEEEEEKPAAVHPNSIEVIFENQSGKSIEIYWDDTKDGILQGTLQHTHEITINTFLGHRFYYTPMDSKGKKAKSLYEALIEEHTGLVTLYPPNIMKERGEKFEKEKSAFMKQYLEDTGRRWRNYYPRGPVSQHYFNLTHIGQTFDVTSNATYFTICSSDLLTDALDAELTNLMTAEMARLAENPHKFPEECAEDPNGEDCNIAPPSVWTETETHFLHRMNETNYCRPKVIVDEAKSDLESGALVYIQPPLTFTHTVICPQEPAAAVIDGFLTPAESQHIIQLGAHIGLKRSTVSEEALTTADRTSQTVWVERDLSPVVDNVIRRIATVMRVDPNKLFLNASSESLQLVHYFGGELYKSHVDYGTDRQHSRFITFLMYLVDVEGDGGNTSFPLAVENCRGGNGSDYLGVHPQHGRVLWFYDLFADGNIDPKTQHYAEPPVEGEEKWMTNLWIWDKVFTR